MISKLTSGKNEKLRRGVYIEKLQLDLLLFLGKTKWKAKQLNTPTSGFLAEI